MKKIILIVEDNAVYRSLLVEFANLSGLGADVITAENGKEGFDLFQQYQNDLILVVTDNTLPLMLGIELIRRIKQTKPELPVVLLTSDEPKRVKGHEADIYLRKSTTPRTVFEMAQEKLLKIPAAC